MSIPNQLFSDYLIQYCIWSVRFFFLLYSFVFVSSLEILIDRLNASISCADSPPLCHPHIYSKFRLSVDQNPFNHTIIDHLRSSFSGFLLCPLTTISHLMHLLFLPYYLYRFMLHEYRSKAAGKWNYLSPSVTNVENEWRYFSIHTIFLNGACTFIFAFTSHFKWQDPLLCLLERATWIQTVF